MVNVSVEQIRTNALVAKTIHRKRLKKARLFSNILSAFMILVPVVFLAAQYWAKGTTGEQIVNGTAAVGSVLLLCLSVMALILRIETKVLDHSVGIRTNIYVASEAHKLMNETDEVKLGWFYTYVSEMDVMDASSLADAKPAEKRDAYREALMELRPGDNSAVCPICKASPFRYTKGDCQFCGNTPIREDIE